MTLPDVLCTETLLQSHLPVGRLKILYCQNYSGDGIANSLFRLDGILGYARNGIKYTYLSR